MKKLLPILIALLAGLYAFPVFAAEGSIQITLPEELKGIYVYYTEEGEDSRTVIVDEKGIASITGLKEGMYQIEIPNGLGYEFNPISVHVPSWSEEEQKMLYDISVIPKYIHNVEPPKEEPKEPPKEEPPKTESPRTGDESNERIYIGLGIISLIIVAIMTCHNRFKCGRMTQKYSRKRRT